MIKVVKWWKDKFWLQTISISFATMILAFLLTYLISWGWILSIFIVCVGGGIVGKLIKNRLKQLRDEILKTF